MIDELLRPLDFEFFRNGLIVATMSGAPVRRDRRARRAEGMSYIGHGRSHAIFGGFATSSLLGFDYLLGASSAPTRRSASSRRRRSHSAWRCFALFGTSGRSFDAALFGSILGVGLDDVVAIFVVSILATVLILLRHRALLFTTFDPEVADVAGVNTTRCAAVSTRGTSAAASSPSSGWRTA